ncbi:MAG: hypothetical protein KF767_05020 [Bdellovibrionaceae bacterium]|nr:hypothetical protein [Pseudobdellovibrionaceae bacterium]
MKSLTGLGVMLLLGVPALAAVKNRVIVADPPKTIQLDVREVLSMPAENRLAVAEARRDLLAPELEKLAFDGKVDFAERWKAVVLYAQLRGPESRGFLARTQKSNEWFMRNAGLVAYQSVLPREARTVAKERLTDKALVVRSAAILVLEAEMDSEIRELFWNEIDQPRNFRKTQGLWTRPQMLEILAKEPKDREAPLFLAYLRETDARMHRHAVSGLEKLTRQTLGKTESPLAEKRDLWLKWAARAENSQRL